MGEMGSSATAEGYTRNASPGPAEEGDIPSPSETWHKSCCNPPESATSATDRPCSLAMYPMVEKMTNPAKKLVELLMQEMIRASLKSEQVRNQVHYALLM